MRKYSIIIILLLALIGPAVVFGQSNNADCGMVDNTIVDLNILGSINPAFVDLLPEEAQKRATKNLRAYCCDLGILKKESCDKTTTDRPPEGFYPQSTYLFDHIVDVMMRRLDGNPELIYPDIPLHPVGKEWREKIRTLASNPAGSKPLEILNAAKPYWLNQSPNASMIALYDKVCDSAYTIYTAQVEAAKGIKSTPGALLTTNDKEKCQTMVAERVQYELRYISVLINLSSNRALQDYMQKQLSDYFATTRLTQLQSTISQMVDAFQTVNRFIVEGTKQCSM